MRITLESYETQQRSPRRLPHSARSSRCGCEHGIWGRQEARSPEGASTGRWGHPNPSLSATAPSLHVGVRRWHPSLGAVALSGLSSLSSHSTPAGGRALRCLSVHARLLRRHRASARDPFATRKSSSNSEVDAIAGAGVSRVAPSAGCLSLDGFSCSCGSGTKIRPTAVRTCAPSRSHPGKRPLTTSLARALKIQRVEIETSVRNGDIPSWKTRLANALARGFATGTAPYR